MMTHLKFAVRVFLKDKFFSVLNILGLALGISVSIILLLILRNDLTYDQYHTNYNRIYRVSAHEWATGLDIYTSRSARELGTILQEEFPEVESSIRINNWDRSMVTIRNSDGTSKQWYEERIFRTDSNFFEFFTHRLIAGDPKTCLKQLNTLVLSESTAKKYFGNENPLDKEIDVRGDLYKVTGVVEDVPENSHIKFDLLLSQLPAVRQWAMQNGKLESEAFWNPDVFTYIMVPVNYDVKNFYDKWHIIFDKYYKPFGDKVDGHYEAILEPMADIHFHSDMQADMPHGNISYLYAFTGIGIFIILLACINYMNLSTAKSVNRASEIAMKKTLGSGKGKLVANFLTESVLLSLIAMVLALGIVLFVIGATSFNTLIGKNLSTDFLTNPVLMLSVVGLSVGVGLLSGIYPALYLPSIPTLTALKGAFKNRNSSLFLRKILTTAQFAISIFVVICTVLMKDQIEFVRNKELGFEKDNMVLLQIQDTIVQHQIDAIRQEFLRDSRILAATTAYNVPGYNMDGGAVMWAEGETGMVQQSFSLLGAGDGYIKALGIQLVAGRDFQDGDPDANRNFIVNEAAVRLMGWTNENAIGKKLRWFHDTDETKQVVGVVKDFNWNSLHNKIEPLVILKDNDKGGFLHLKIAGGDIPGTLEFIKGIWTKYDTTHPYEYAFLDQRFDEQYKEDETQRKLLAGLSYVCIFISLLGLLGLSAFTAAQRTKEIGIRKVHGASIPQIIFLLYREVMLLVIVAVALVVPAAIYTINQWLGSFAYQKPINYILFGAVGLLALLFSLMTVAFHSYKTARMNPVNSLKYE